MTTLIAQLQAAVGAAHVLNADAPGFRDELAAVIAARQSALEAAELDRELAAGRIDVTQPGRGQQPGGLHPVSRTRRRIETIFRNAGFSQVMLAAVRKHPH